MIYMLASIVQVIAAAWAISILWNLTNDSD